MRINVHGGTTRDDGASLCLTCRYATIVQGTKASERIVRCSRVESPIPFKVTSCSEYINRQHASLYHMEDIAWILRTDNRSKQAGFVRSRDLPVKDRLFIDED